MIITVDVAAAVELLIKKIDDFATRELNRIGEIKDNVDKMKQQREDIEAVLREFSAIGEAPELAKLWLIRVRDLAYDIDDVIDKFDFYVSRHSTLSKIPLLQKRSICEAFEKIKSKIDSVKNSREDYQHFGLSSYQCHNHGTCSYNDALYETDVVGIEKPRGDLMAWARKKEPNLQVMFIVGIGGSGKTLLANQVYQRVKEEFDFCDWIPLSSSQNGQQLLQTMLRNLCDSKHVPGQCSSTDQRQLMDQLRSFLNGKSYLVIFDDLRSKEMWESIKLALPPQTKGRVIVTTRRGDIAHLSRLASVDVYNHQLLPPAEAKKLFLTKAFPSNGECSETLLDQSKRFLMQCEGMPLAIVSIGNLLSSTEQTADAWRQLHDSLGSELQTTHRLSRIRDVFFASWNDLRHDLQYCLLCFAIFPEDYPIPRRKLIRLWISEGLVRKIDGRTPEQVGEDYLYQLIQRGLVLVDELDFNGRAKFCHVHRLFHKIVLSKATQENFCKVSTDSEAIQGENVRRLSVLKSCSSMSGIAFPGARTFFAFQLEEKLSTSAAERIFSQFCMLRVLDLEDAPLEKFPQTIVKLVFLRYLSLRNTKIRSLPRSIANLQNLEVLDLKHTLVTELPSKVFKLKKLRHLLVYRYNISNYVSISCVQGFKASRKIGRLEALQKVSLINANGDDKMIKALQNLINLKKLGIINLKEKDGTYLWYALERMTNLRSLDLSSSTEEEYLGIHEMPKPPEHLQRLYLKGRLRKLPDFVSTLHDLVRIRLKWSRLTTNPIDALQGLPNLMELQLLDAYTGTSLSFPARKFQKLKILELESLGALNTVTMEKGTLVSLKTIILRRCGAMVIAPVGIEQLPVLENLHLYDMPEMFLLQLRSISLVRYIPHICTFSAGNGSWKNW